MTKRNDTPDVRMLDDTAEYLDVAFAVVAQTGGFSKGTANVTAGDVKKLHGLLEFYSKKPHPFTACVKDNRKRFGAKTEAYCAVLKDLIVGNTKWRNGGKHTAKGVKMSEEALVEIYGLELPEGFLHYLSELDDAELALMMAEEGDETELDDPLEPQLVFAAGDLVWKPSDGYSELRRQVDQALRAAYPPSVGGTYSDASSYYCEDIDGERALVCNYPDYFVVPFTRNGEDVVLSAKTDWIPVEKGWVQEGDEGQNYAEDGQILVEMNFADGETKEDADGLIWKTVLREGTWAFSPGAGQKPVAKPITVVKTGDSNPKTLTISMAELKRNFEAGAVESVTIPTSHADKVLENTGFVKKLKWGKDAEGRATLKAGLDFTEPDVKEKALRGTIANTSGGILFDYVGKEKGTKFNSVLAHVALTNHPWLNGMEPFGVNASEGLQVLAFSEGPLTTGQEPEGGTMKTEAEKAAEREAALAVLGLSEDQAAAAQNVDPAQTAALLAENERLAGEVRKGRIDQAVAGYESAKKSPAMVTVAKALLSASNDDTVLNLSEEGKTVELTAFDIVNRLMEAAPEVKLSEEQITEQQVAGERPADNADGENDEANLSEEVKAETRRLFFDEGLSQADALAAAKKKFATADANA